MMDSRKEPETKTLTSPVIKSFNCSKILPCTQLTPLQSGMVLSALHIRCIRFTDKFFFLGVTAPHKFDRCSIVCFSVD